MSQSLSSTAVPEVTGLVVVNPDGSNIGGSTGGATASNQTDGSQKTQIVDAGGEVATVTGGKLDVNATLDTTGLATSALQTTGNDSLSSINTKIPAQGQALAAASIPVVLPAAQITTLTPPAAITGYATETTLGSVKTAVELVDDSVVAQGTALGSTKNLMVGASVTTAAPTYTTGQINPLNLATTGALRVDIGATSANATAVKVNVASGGIASGAIASGAIASGAIASGAIASGAIAVGAIAAGATSIAENEDVAHTTGDRGIKVWGTANEANTVRAADNDYVPFATDTEGNMRIVGNRDFDAVDAGEPVKIGGQARTTNPTAVADADRVNFIADKLGKQVVVGSIRDLKGRQTTTITASTTETTIVTAIASTFIDIYGLILANSGTTATTVQLRDTTAGTVLATFYVPAGDTRGFMLPESAALAQTTVNTNWTVQCGSSTSSMIVTALYVKNT